MWVLRSLRPQSAGCHGLASTKQLCGAIFHPAILGDADISFASCEAAFVLDHEVDGASFSKASLKRARLIQADLCETFFDEATLEGADLTGAIFRGRSYLGGSDLERANLRGANLTNVNFMGTDLLGADLTGTILTGSIYDSETIWPEDFDFIGSGATERFIT